MAKISKTKKDDSNTINSKTRLENVKTKMRNYQLNGDLYSEDNLNHSGFEPQSFRDFVNDLEVKKLSYKSHKKKALKHLAKQHEELKGLETFFNRKGSKKKIRKKLNE
ncbi:MAG: hypothetical protein IPG89_19215 [Bacteroidetes bacterium]|nr:hypothetical protein [Bacteroidota bacterium]